MINSMCFPFVEEGTVNLQNITDPADDLVSKFIERYTYDRELLFLLLHKMDKTQDDLTDLVMKRSSNKYQNSFTLM